MYKEFKPAGELAPYIDAYWQVTGEGKGPVAQRIPPDGCIDIIVNLGDDFLADRNGFVMKNETAYLVGTMTRYKETTRDGNTHLVGIRFKPAAFTHFYQYASLHELTDTTIEFEQMLTPAIGPMMTAWRGRPAQFSGHMPGHPDHPDHLGQPDHLGYPDHPGYPGHATDLSRYLNRYFLGRLSTDRQCLFPIIDEINSHRGQISVPALAKKHFISIRRLERIFKQQIGLSPKEFINFVRYQFALENIRNDHATKSFLEIAFDSGYYDHAHLANEIRKYSGMAPSQL